MRKPPTSKRAVGIKHGFRSGLEEKVAEQLEVAGVPFEYEGFKVSYEVPSRKATYTPDFRLPNGIIIETKGRFLTEDRQKHILVKQQCPGLDIRFVFTNPNAPIYKGSPTTLADWCHKNGFQYAKKLIPGDWLQEEPKTEG